MNGRVDLDALVVWSWLVLGGKRHRK